MKKSVFNAYPDLLIIQEFAYNFNQLIIKNYIKETESKEYSACMFELNNQRICYRLAKITPKKNGQFVTLWKRSIDGLTIPYDLKDSIDLFVITVRNGENLGQFVFPKTILYEKGFISKEQHGGKRGMRVYPLWDKPDNVQAIKTQKWQLLYFFEIKPVLDVIKMYQLLRSELLH